jgi:hypothetical protein
MGNLLFWLGIGAAQKGAGSFHRAAGPWCKPMERRHWAAALVVGFLIAVLSIYSVGQPKMMRR